MNGLTSVVMLQESWFWKQSGAEDFSILAGQMKANAKLFKKRKVLKSTGFSIVLIGRKSGAKPQRPSMAGKWRACW